MSNEHIWYGKFGDEYTKRNDKDFQPRAAFWNMVCDRYGFANILEVGCGSGMNLSMIAGRLDHPSCAWGIDINQTAIGLCKMRNPELNVVLSSGLDLPFRDEYFDAVFTAGVLIHQTPDTVEHMMQEIIRVSNRFVFAIEYEDEIFKEVEYRGMKGALFKGPWGDIYEKRYGLKLLDKEPAGKDVGFDSCTFWALSKR